MLKETNKRRGKDGNEDGEKATVGDEDDNNDEDDEDDGVVKMVTR